MFPSRFFGDRFFGNRYFPDGAGIGVVFVVGLPDDATFTVPSEEQLTFTVPDTLETE